MKIPMAGQVVLGVVLLGIIAFIVFRAVKHDPGVTEQTYFYDLSEKKLFAAPLESDPPIKGINDNEHDAVRAVVITTSDNPKDRSAQRIAYLEKYAPQLIQHLAEVRAGKAEPLPTKVRNGYRLVKRMSDADWHALSSPEGQKIITEWSLPGADGKTPSVCTP